MRSLVTVLVVLGGAVDRRNPALATFHPDLCSWRQFERCIVEASDPDLDDAVLEVGEIEQPGSASSTEAATVVGCDLTRQLEHLDRPLRVDAERASGFLSAVCTVASHDVQWITADAVADCSAKASTGPHLSLHA